jgi:hypothetical protein
VVIRLLEEKWSNNFPPYFSHQIRTPVVTRCVDDLNGIRSWPPIWGFHVKMSEETEAKALVAGSIMAMAMVPISIKVAMHHAGFSEKEIENRSLQQKVRRKGSKAPPSTVSFTPSNESSSVSTFSHSQAASSITPTIRQDSMPSSSILVSSILPSSGSIHRQSRSRTRRANEDLLQSSQHLQTLLHLSQEPQAEGENGEDSKPPAKKKSRKSPVERQKTDAEACLLNKKQSDAFKLATSRYALSLTLEAGDPEKKSCETICDEVNAMKETSVSRRTGCDRDGHICWKALPRYQRQHSEQ